MDYSQLSDFEINVAVFEALHDGSPDCKEGDDGAMLLVSFEGDVVGGDIVEVEVVRGSFDPCNNASDAWPIIQDNFISIIFDEDGNEPPQNAWCKAITKTGESHYGSEKEPLKTAMIAFLMKANKCTFCDGIGFIQIDHGENIGIEHKACPQCEGKCYVHP